MPLRASPALFAGLLMTADLLLAAGLARGAEAPDEGFLEFLGMLVEDNGDYLDPVDLAGVELPEADASSAQEPGEETAEENADE